ncbi:hypothetical protein HGP28_03515 [Vibrio sp. SM6]|uniref:Uncharacterized protein n=1 Tax=Vibrio agarilyticus TaxID=2726741 RepID=A0A7X8TNF3_9VIBR|nr:hypothetical protein [Vibrio agarilyticus]NLS11958.1 hypothetical protein [Vibrio agarilyticus]
MTTYPNLAANLPLAQAIDQVSEQLEATSMKALISGALASTFEKQSHDIDALLAAYTSGEIDKQTLMMELEREKQIAEIELLSWQIAAKAQVQQVVNQVFSLVEKAVLP